MQADVCRRKGGENLDDQSWVVDNLQNALTTWNDKLNEIWTLLTVSPQSFKGGGVWGIVTSINSALLPIAYGLLVLFFAMSVCKTCGSLTEIKRPEHALRLFIRFALAKAAVTYCMELLTSLFTIAQGIVAQIIGTAGLTGPNGGSLPQELIDTINACGFWESIPLWAVTLLGSLFITVMSFIMILTVYGRFFRLFMYTAIAPVPLSAFAGETTSRSAKAFVRSYLGVCLEGAIIALACTIYSSIAVTPAVSAGATPITATWGYVSEVVFGQLVLVGTIKASDHIVKDMLGL